MRAASCCVSCDSVVLVGNRSFGDGNATVRQRDRSEWRVGGLSQKDIVNASGLKKKYVQIVFHPILQLLARLILAFISLVHQVYVVLFIISIHLDEFDSYMAAVFCSTAFAVPSGRTTSRQQRGRVERTETYQTSANSKPFFAIFFLLKWRWIRMPTSACLVRLALYNWLKKMQSDIVVKERGCGGDGESESCGEVGGGRVNELCYCK